MRKRSPTHRSKFEVKVEALLRERPDLTSEYENETLSYTLALNYTPDWSVKLNSRGDFDRVDSKDSKPIILEAKGVFDYVERRKILAVKKAHPERDIRMVFMRNNRIQKNSKTTYTDWCLKNGIPCAVYPNLPL